MKNENNNLELEQLLAEVEHAGRDARRQQVLGEMIDRMAEAGTRKRGKVVRLWAVRLAAAACVTFFIVTAVRVWFIPTNGDTMVAENVMPELPSPVPAAVTTDVELEGETPALPCSPRVATENSPRGRASATVAWAVAESVAEFTESDDVEFEKSAREELMVMEEYVAEAIAETEDWEKVGSDAASGVDDIVVPVVSLGSDEMPSEERHVQQEHARRGLSFSLFRRAAPSHMDGTLLAFNLL